MNARKLQALCSVMASCLALLVTVVVGPPAVVGMLVVGAVGTCALIAIRDLSLAPWPVLGRLVFAVTVVLIVIVVCVLLLSTGRAGAEPLKISKFSLQTTEAVKVDGPLTHDSWGFQYRPVEFTQAAGHPQALTATIEFENQELASQGPTPTRDPKDIAVAIPPGLLGNPMAVRRCSLKLALSGRQCPAGTQVGVAVLYYQHGAGRVAPIVNVTPEAGQSAEFAIETIDKVSFILTGRVVRTPAGYGIAVLSKGVPNAEVSRVETTFWGVPAAKVNDPERGLACERDFNASEAWSCGAFNADTGELYGFGGKSSEEPEIPFLTMPSDCSAGPESAKVKADSWEEPGRFIEKEAETPFPTVLSGSPRGMSGCDGLRFQPAIEIQPDTLLADAPVALGVNLTVPQSTDPHASATPEIRKTAVTLPSGMSISPGIVDGIQACEANGPEGIDIPSGLNAQGQPLAPDEVGVGEEIGVNGEPQLAAGHCPDASVVGTAKAISPLLPEPIEGHVFLAKPGCGGAGQAACTEQDALDGNLYQLYLELGGKGALANTGVNIKVRLKTEANLVTGQLTSIADEVAQLPFSKLEVKLNGGPRAALDNPAVCGPAQTTADLTPWSAPGITPQGLLVAGLPDAAPSSFFEVQGCSTPPPFAPGFTAGTVTPNAGKFTAFTLNVSRKDREQYVKGVQLRTPPGLLGVLASVPLCGEAQADAGTCPETSKIGTTRVASGAGSHPFEIEGSIYLTASYRGAPFGLSIVTDAVAGPFDLGKVVVRARITVDPHDSSLIVSTDESGPYAVPRIIFGVPLRLQRITANIDRAKFMFNPTNCKAQRIVGNIAGAQSTVASVSSPFAVGGCRGLAFKPSFAVATNGHTTRSKGASLDARLSFPKDALGSDANVARVKVSLPKQLPSRLTTLQKACPVQIFQVNPANCPAASVVGIARALTPLLAPIRACAPGLPCSKEPPASVIGPAYFVSYGGEAFPQLIVVLQGEGVRVDLVGNTFISKGITSSTFKTVPDVPVASFELYLPQGRFSALSANGNLCRQAGRLNMPTEFVAQNGAVLRQSTHIKVTGCAKKRTHKKAKSGRAGK